jgi:hypothetical protein
MSTDTASPYTRFKDKICTFAEGQHGIRNPFIIAAVEPALEHRLSNRLAGWADEQNEGPMLPEGVTVQPIWLDELLPRTDVYNLLVDLGDELAPEPIAATPAERIESTMKDRLTAELVEELLADVEEERLEMQRHVLLLMHLGSLYPFSRASELLDELDRRNVKSTIGIPFPGEVVGGKLNFFGTDSRHYYPAHQIEGTIREVHLQ